MWFLLVGCAEPNHFVMGTGAGPSPIRVDPIALFFGDVPWNEPAVESLTLQNSSEEAHSIDLVCSSDAVEMDSRSLTLEPGETTTLGVRWGADSFDEIDATIDVRVDGETTAIVAVSGVRTYPQLRMLPPRLVIDDVPLGCNGHAEGRLVNRGTLDATITSVELLENDGEFRLDSAREPVEVPLWLVPGYTVQLGVWFTPNAEHESATTIRIGSNAPTPTIDVQVVGRGVLETTEPVSLSWTVAPSADALTALFEVNAEVADYGAPVVDAFGAFFAALDETEIPYRVAIVQDDLFGAVRPYIDDTFTSDGAVDMAGTMLANLTGDQDESLAHLLDGIDQNRAWLFDEDDPDWGAAPLHLVGMNVDAEQSPKDAAYYVERYRELKDDPSLIRVHGIAGPPPAGCAGDAGASYALPSENLLTAVNLTGGSFRSICEDWTANLEGLARAMQATSFRLEGVPIESTIEVAIDGALVTSGWSYDAITNEIVFDDATYPAVGSKVDVTYSTAPSCR